VTIRSLTITAIKIAGTLATVCGLSCFYTATAATGCDSISLTEVTVTARRPYSEIIPAQTLSGNRLEALRSHNVADALRYFSGVQIKDYGGVGGVKTVDMRSMGTNHMGIFYDGIQLGNAQNGQIDLGRFSLDNLEAIDMYNGQKSDIFQSAKDYGSAGTLYLQSRRPIFHDDERPWKANVTLRGGSFGLINPSGRFDWKINDRISATVSAEYTYATERYRFRYRKLYTDGSVAWDTTATRRNGDIHALRAEAGLFGYLPRGYWQGRLYYYDSRRGIPGAIVNNVWKNSQRQWDRNFFVQGHWKRDLSDIYSLQLKAKYARDYMRYLNPDTTLMHIDNRFNQDEIYLSAANKFKVKTWWDVNLAVDYQWNTLGADIVNFAHPQRHTLMSAIATAITHRNIKFQASLLWTMVHDRHRISPDGAPVKNDITLFNRLTPAVFWSFTPSRDWTVRAFYKRAFRMPTFNDLYYTDIGNASLKPETVDQYNIGAVFHHDFTSTIFNSIDVSTDAYHNYVTDKIIAIPKGNGQYRWMMMNIGKVKILGVDVTATVNASPLPQVEINGRLNYTFQSARDFSDPTDNRPGGVGTYKGQIAYIPRHSGSTAWMIRWKTAELNYSFIYVSERWHNSSNIPENYEPAWYTHDLSIAYRFTLGGHTQMRAALEINNLLGQQYEVITNYPMPGRNYRATLSVDF